MPERKLKLNLQNDLTRMMFADSFKRVGEASGWHVSVWYEDKGTDLVTCLLFSQTFVNDAVANKAEEDLRKHIESLRGLTWIA